MPRTRDASPSRRHIVPDPHNSISLSGESALEEMAAGDALDTVLLSGEIGEE